MWPMPEKHQQPLAFLGRSAKLDEVDAAEPTELGWHRKGGGGIPVMLSPQLDTVEQG